MITKQTMIKIQYWINASLLIWGAWKISTGDVKNGLYLIVGFFLLCTLSYILYKDKHDVPHAVEETGGNN